MTAKHAQESMPQQTLADATAASHLTENAPENIAARYVVGIDLGTTNSAVTYVDTSKKKWEIKTLPIPQLVAAGLVESRETLPSFYYEPHADELTPEQMRLPFDTKKNGNLKIDSKSEHGVDYVVGAYARDYGGKVAGRLVASAKSWLCHSGVDRTSKLLPWQAADDVTKLSPVDVTTRYLAHIREAWDHAFKKFPLAEQDVVITLPASFDEIARELTVRAARAAGIPKIVLLEEPQAAFYAWVYEHADDWRTLVSPGQKILVCDIGGGTTDLTLIRVRAESDGAVRFHRTAVGEHLILGGDNLDLALAHHLETRLVGQGKLSPNQWSLLVRIACSVKEKLLAEDAPEQTTVSIPGIGSKLIGGARQIEVTREEIEQLLVDGFMPLVPLDAKPSRHQSGVREFGLPYATDHAITRYLARFLTTHQHTGSQPADQTANSGITSIKTTNDSPIPDIVLFNGGMFEADKMRRRLLNQLDQWAEDVEVSTRCTLLENTRLDLAVARGAAYYGMVRRGFGERISAGLARTYYLGVETGQNDSNNDSQPQLAALCLLPAGTEVDHEVMLADRSFELLVGEPIQFPVFVSSVRLTDQTGELLPFDPQQMTALPPIQTVVKTRSKSKKTVTVQLEGKLTEIGTLELWCVETGGKNRWRLDFDVRSVSQTDRDATATTAEREGIVDEETWQPVCDALAATFDETGSEKPNRLMRRLDEAAEMRRDDWPTSLLRRTGDELIEHFFDGRRKSPEHEARWLNLVGYAYRPGFGLTLDDWRIEQLWRKVQGNLVGKTADCRVQNWVLWRRVAGGLSAGQQKTLADPLIGNVRNLHRQAMTGLGRGADFDLYSQEGAEIWRLLGSLELLPVETKVELGNMIVELFRKKKAAPVSDAMIWALGRLGSRELLYGPLNAVVPPQSAEKWLRKIFERPNNSNNSVKTAAKNTKPNKKIKIAQPATKNANNEPKIVAYNPTEQLAIMQLARKTGDRYRDIGSQVREMAIAAIENRHGGDQSNNQAAATPQQQHLAQLVREVSQLDREEQGAVFGETLPIGLRFKEI